jgi:hypothetical protein
LERWHPLRSERALSGKIRHRGSVIFGQFPALTCRSLHGRALLCSFTKPAIHPWRSIFEG